jgi:hypothetical protein
MPDKGEGVTRNQASPHRDGRLRPQVAYKWVALSVTTLGAAMAAIDSSIVVLGLPTIMTDLRSDLVTMIWALMSYILMSTVFLMLFGRLADMFGRARMYNLGFGVFTVGSLLCALAGSGAQLVLFRLVQGVGGAMLMANGMAISIEAFPLGERGPAMAWGSETPIRARTVPVRSADAVPPLPRRPRPRRFPRRRWTAWSSGRIQGPRDPRSPPPASGVAADGGPTEAADDRPDPPRSGESGHPA